MTSDPSSQECYVYINLPGETQAVTAGRFEIKPDRRDNPRGRFLYGRSYLNRADAVAIDPVELKLTAPPRTYETVAMKGMFGALRDASPDHWGRRVIEKHAGKAPLNEMDYLLELPDDRAGALGFGIGPKPPAPRRDFNQTIDLAKMQTVADAIVKDEEIAKDATSAQIADLMLVGTSMGGARPKAVVETPAHFGSLNSTVRTTGGTMPASSMPC